MSNAKMHVRTGDTVEVISGKDRGKKGKILSVNPDRRMVIVEGVSMAKKHKKPRQMGQQGGIIEQETPIYASKVMAVCSKCSSPTRTGRKVLENGKRVRFCKKCGETFAD